jgi:hypothetical protein
MTFISVHLVKLENIVNIFDGCDDIGLRGRDLAGNDVTDVTRETHYL